MIGQEAKPLLNRGFIVKLKYLVRGKNRKVFEKLE